MKLLLKSKAVEGAVKEHKACWKTLAEWRLGYLEMQGPPQFFWSQPEAVVPGHPSVEKFLRSNEQRDMVYRNFNSISGARSFADGYFLTPFSAKYHHSAQATASGRGRNAFVTIRKTRSAHLARLAAHAEVEREAEGLRRVLGKPPPCADARGSMGRGMVGSRSMSAVAGPKRPRDHGDRGRSPGSGKKARAAVEVIDLCDSS